MATEPITVVADRAEVDLANADGRQAWWLYCTEVLDHLRMPYRTRAPEELDFTAAVDATPIALFPHPPRLDDARLTALTGWVTRGGTVLVCGGPGALGDLSGTSNAGEVAEGHVALAPGGPWAAPPDVALHAFGGVALDVHDDVEVLARWRDGGAALAARPVGQGLVVVVGVDLWQSIVRIQQGWPVERDGTPAPDGSSPVDDGILKCDDGIALCYERDRAVPPGAVVEPFRWQHPPAVAAPVFHRPHADLWRWVFLHCLLATAEHCGAVLPWLFYWPAGVPAVAHMSHDSDGNVDQAARSALAAFAEADVRVTWCHVYPGGYDPATVAAIAEAGHEQALHYNAMADADIAQWGRANLRAQYAWAQAVTGRERIVSNKNHYTRWEGWDEFYHWCEELGIEIDQSRGPSKQGNVGFPFGTCHVGFPIADHTRHGRRLDVLALPLHTQDLAWAAHESVRDVILDQARYHHGVAHFLFHAPHLHARPPVRQACLTVAAEARRRGMPWWTSEQINRWERGRRGVVLAVAPDPAGGWRVSVTSAEPISAAAILLAMPDVTDGRTGQVVEGDASTAVVRRHGRLFVEITADLPAGSTTFLLGE